MSASAQVTLYRTYALFLQSFVRYSSWPATPAEFKVVVIGETQAYSDIQKNLDGKLYGGTVAKVIKSNDADNLADAAIVYLAEDKSNLLATVLKNTEGRAVMIVTEREGLYRAGASISFALVDNRLRYDVNTRELQKRNLKTSAQLISLAHNVLD
ncbi:YfiR family protein [Ohtaekwangia sp.]|uniref:YfiR family protein n=1 Tax=Ohtaekwangia sp. TaxID=2066019 RepID=UPI002F93769D